MAILFAGTLPADFELLGAGASATQDANAGADTDTPDVMQIRGDTTATARFAAQSSVWCHAKMSFLDDRNTGLDDPVIQIRDGTDIIVEFRAPDQFDPDVEIMVSDGTSLSSLHTFVIGEDIPTNIDIELVLGVSGTLKVYIDNTQVVDYSADMSFASTVDNMVLSGPADSTSDVTAAGFASVIVADTSTLGMKLNTMYPTVDGGVFQWVGATADIDDPAIDDLTFVTSDAAAEVFTCEKDNLGATAFDVAALVISTRARDTGATGTIAGVVRISSTNYTEPAQSLVATFEPYQFIFDQNPATTSAWDQAAIDTVEIGLESG